MFEKKEGVYLTLRLRASRPTEKANLYARFRYDGGLTTEYALDIYVSTAAWVSSLRGYRPDHPQAEALRLRLEQVTAEHETIRRFQEEKNTFIVTAETIRRQWQEEALKKFKKQPLKLLLTQAFTDYLDSLRQAPVDERKSEKTIQNNEFVGVHLSGFLKKEGTPQLFAEAVTPGWGKRFYDYLRQKGMAKDGAARYVMTIRAVLAHALTYDRIERNGLYEFKAPKGQGSKPIYFLSQQQLADLATLPLTSTQKQVRDWALFMCYTGLDYNDAVQVVDNPQAYYIEDGGLGKWVYQRLKLKRNRNWGECHIPILPQAAELLPTLATSNKLKLDYVNGILKELAQQLSLPFSFTSKICRKTAGAVFVELGYRMESVQKILGHQSLAMTEKHYVTVRPSVVDRDTERIAQANKTCFVRPLAGGNNPFLRIA